jgi:hypothetical protein
MSAQPVRIAVVYHPGKRPRPVWFELNNRQHHIKATTYFWRDKAGDKRLLHYAVTTGEALFELVFDPMDETWTIESQQIDE